MSIEQIIEMWKSDEKSLVAGVPESPVGQELSDESLEQVVGGSPCMVTCDEDWTCSISCFVMGTHYGSV